MLLLVVASSVVDSDWQVASDEGQYVASCCCGQHCRFGWRVASDEVKHVASCCRRQHCRFGLASCKR